MRKKTWILYAAAAAAAAGVVSPTTARAGALTDVSPGEMAGMRLLYAVNDGAFDFNDAYLVNNAASIATGSFSRVGYYVQLGPNWVWTSMNTFNTNPARVGVPKAGTNIVEVGTAVTGLNVETNHPNVIPVTGGNGVIEFWASNYNANGSGALGSDNAKYDWRDSGGTTSSGHGSFQVFHMDTATHGRTMFGITANGGAGIGDQPTATRADSPDWTFGAGTSTYSVRNLEIWVNTVPEPTSAALLGLAAVGLLARRGKARRTEP